MAGSVADTWSGASYERLAETYAPIHDRFAGALGLEPGSRMLDVACGTGAVALRAARLGADVVGIDISVDQLAKARRAAAADGLDIRFEEGDCQELEFRTGDWRVRADSGEALWELVSTSMPPLRAWLAEQSGEARSRAEQVYLAFLAPAVLEREYVLVLGTRR